MEPSRRAAWFAAWEDGILRAAERRYCDRETGEELGWLVSPFLMGFHHAYILTGEERWLDLFEDWAGSWLRRAVREPDGYLGWPKEAGASTAAVPELFTDNMLGEAMAMRPLALMATALLAGAAPPERRPAARAWLDLNRHVAEKWESRGCWRPAGDGGVWVVPPFGLDRATGGWTDGYARRAQGGFSLPANKQNQVALWMLDLHAATGEPRYRERAQAWFCTMRARMRLRDGGRYWVWNYWDPAGPWDLRADGSPRHWVGVHPNGGYYALDAEGLVAARDHGLAIGEDDLARLLATNRDFMWNGQVAGARFRRIDGGEPDPRWADRPGCLWTALVPYDARLRLVFEANHDPGGWGGLAATPWYLRLAGPT